MEQEGIVCLGLGCKTIVGKTCIIILVLWIPGVRIRRIADNSIDSQWLADLRAFLVDRPVLFEGVGTTGDNILGDDATHHKVHTSKVVGVNH